MLGTLSRNVTRRLVVVRHGETDWNREGQMQGWAPVPLNERGRRQARAAGEWIAGRYDVDAVHASDLLRCRETVEEMLPALDDPGVSYEPAWRERDIGVYQGLPYDDVFERFPEFALGEASARAAARAPESGESLVAVAERVGERADELLAAAAPDGTRLVVTHGGPMDLLLGHVKGLDVSEAVLSHEADNCAVTVVEADGDGPRVVAENRTGWKDEGGDGRS